MRRLLLLSNSRDGEGRYLYHPREALLDHLHGVRTVTFVPFAGKPGSWDAYAAKVSAAFEPLGIRIESIHDGGDARARIRAAEAIAIGGGNTFHLLATLQRLELVDSIRERAMSGVPYVGWSAGSVIACPTLRTTNDMPIIQPRSFDALGLVSFQINAHFTDAHPPGFQGETRRERITEFLTLNPTTTVVGLPEGDWLRVSGSSVVLEGWTPAWLFRAGHEAENIAVGHRLDDY